MLAYSLNKDLNGNKILSDLQKLIDKHRITSSSLLVIQIREICSEVSEHIPKIEYKPS